MLKVGYLFFLKIFFLSPVFLFAFSEIQVTTVYPAPFGDFENVTTNSLNIIGTIRAPLSSGLSDIDPSVHRISDLNRIRTYRGLRVLGEFVAPYSTVDRSTFPLADFCDYDWDRVIFNRGGKGIFFNNSKNALFFFNKQIVKNTVTVNQDNIGLRAKNNIILHPGAPSTSSFDSYQITFNEDKTIYCNGKLIVKGDLSVKKSDGSVILKVTDSGISVNGDLSVNGNFTVSGVFSAVSSQFKNLRVTNALIVQNKAEEELTYQDESNREWTHALQNTYTKTKVLMSRLRVKDLFLLESTKEAKRRIASGGSGWTWNELPKNQRSKLQIAGMLIAKCINSPFFNKFEIREAARDYAFARFSIGGRGTRVPVLEVPGIIKSRANNGQRYV